MHAGGLDRLIDLAGSQLVRSLASRFLADGTQHVRATVGVHEVQLKVLDFYGGTAWTYHEGYHYGPGRRVKTGDVLKGTVRLKFLPRH